MIKIVYLSQFSNIGGGEVSLINLLSKLNRKKFEPIVILPFKGQFSKVLNKMHIQTHFLYINPYLIRTFFVPGASINSVFQFNSLIKKINPDLIHINNLSLVIYGGLAGKLLKIPVIATSHGVWDSFYFYQDFLYSLFLKKILTNSISQRRILLKKGIIPSKKLKVLPFGIDLNKFKPKGKNRSRTKLKIPLDKNVVSIVGRIDPVKDHITFLKSAEIILNLKPDTYFLIAGSNKGDFSTVNKPSKYLNTLKTYIKNSPVLKKRVRFLGFVENIADVYSSSDVCISSSLSESFGLSLAESLACKTPVVSTNKGNQSLIVKKGQNGFLVPPERPDLIAKKTLYLLNNKSICAKFGSFGRKFVEKKFNLIEYIKKAENVYLTAVKKSS